MSNLRNVLILFYISKYLAFALNKVSINNHNHLKHLIIVYRITRFNEQSDVKLNDIEPN